MSVRPTKPQLSNRLVQMYGKLIDKGQIPRKRAGIKKTTKTIKLKNRIHNGGGNSSITRKKLIKKINNGAKSSHGGRNDSIKRKKFIKQINNDALSVYSCDNSITNTKKLIQKMNNGSKSSHGGSNDSIKRKKFIKKMNNYSKSSHGGGNDSIQRKKFIKKMNNCSKSSHGGGNDSIQRKKFIKKMNNGFQSSHGGGNNSSDNNNKINFNKKDLLARKETDTLIEQFSKRAKEIWHHQRVIELQIHMVWHRYAMQIEELSGFEKKTPEQDIMVKTLSRNVCDSECFFC